MIDLLEKAFAEAAALPEPEQRALAQWLLDELASERRWDTAFRESQEALARLAAEALAEYHSGGTTELTPESL